MAIPGAELEIELRPNDQGLRDAMERWARELGDARGEIEQIRRSTKATAVAAQDVADKGWSAWVIGLNSAWELANKVGGALGDVVGMIRESAVEADVERAFTRQFADAAERLDTLRAAVGGTLADTTLRQIAQQAQQAGIATGDLVTVLNTAARAAVASGQDVGDAAQNFLDIVIGASDSGLEQYGIVADMGTVTEAWAQKQGVAKDAIDKTHQSMAMLEFVTREVAQRMSGVRLEESVVVQVDALTQSFDRVTTSVKRFGMEAVVGTARILGILDDVPDYAGAMEERIARLEVLRRQEGAALAEIGEIERRNQILAENMGTAAREAPNRLVAVLGDVARVQQEVAQAAGEHEDAMRVLVSAVDRHASATLTLQGALDGETATRRDMVRVAAEHIVAMESEAFLTREQVLRGNEVVSTVTAIADAYGARNVVMQEAVRLLREQEAAEFAAAEAAANARLAAEIGDAQRRAAVQESLAFLADQRAEAAARGAGSSGRSGGGRGGGSSRDTAGEYGMSQFLAGNDALRDLRAEQRAAQAAEDAAAFDSLGAFGADADESIRQVNAAREAVDALSMSFSAFGTAYQDSFAESLRQTGIIVADEVARVIGIFDSAREAGLSTSQAVGKMVPGALNAAAGIVKAVGGSVQAQEVLYGLSDTAMAATRYAFGDIVGGTAFAASAGLHFYAAAAAGQKSGGPSGAAPRAPGRAPVGTFGGVSGGPAMQGGTGTVQINFSGATIVGPGGVREAGRAVTSMVGAENRRGSRSAEFQAYG